MPLGERILTRLSDLRLSQAELARRVGISQPSINHLIKNGAQGSKYLHKIARELQTTVAYLTGEIDDPDEGALPAPTPGALADQLDLVLVPHVDLSLGMGGTFIDGPISERTIPFPRDWLREFTDADPANLFFARGKGDSMVPTIMDRDIVLIDRSVNSINDQDRIWAIAYGDLGAIKRIRAMPGGSYKIMSDNAAVEAETAVDDEMFVIGRVVGIFRKA